MVTKLPQLYKKFGLHKFHALCREFGLSVVWQQGPDVAPDQEGLFELTSAADLIGSCQTEAGLLQVTAQNVGKLVQLERCLSEQISEETN
jgi:hypothetical protein